MAKLPKPISRPPAYEPNSYPWNLRRVPERVEIEGKLEPHPGRRCAVFVVHGMGEQQWTETATLLRSGFEDAFDVIRDWQHRHPEPNTTPVDQVPPPFTYEGYWANYTDLKKSFPEDWENFNKRERLFFSHLWERRAYSALRTCAWLLGQQVRLLDPRNISAFKLPVWLIYLTLQVLFPLGLLAALVRSPRIITRILADVRLYAHPQGITERAIIQRIDYRVGREFLRLIGLGWDFRPLPDGTGNQADERVMASGKPYVFDRVVWVAHSLGTVISYNVLSDLFRRAADLDLAGDREQKAGVAKFRRALRRFVTLGSPLDKFAFLFPDALRPWPTHDRPSLLPDAGDEVGTTSDNGASGQNCEGREWWINYYTVLDPVSGRLHSPLICGQSPPLSLHTALKSSALIPGLAHSSYWSAPSVLRFVLGRVYGRAYLRDGEVERQKASEQIWFLAFGYVCWALVLGGGVLALFLYRGGILSSLWKALKAAAGSLVGV